MRRTALALVVLLIPSCGSPQPASDASAEGGVDSGAAGDSGPDGGPDAGPLPPGPRGDVLRVPLDADFAIPTLRGSVQVVYTERGIPHLYASNDRDSYVVMGFLHARDRYFQMELIRRYGLGLISELLGDAGLATDQAQRGRGTRDIVDRLLARLTPEQGDQLDAYVEGINAAIAATKARRLPAPTELPSIALLLGVNRATDLMTPFTRRDVAAVLAAVLFNSSFTDDDLVRSRLERTLDQAFATAPQTALRRAGARADVFDWVTPTFPEPSAPGFGVERGTRMVQRAPRLRRRGAELTVPTELLERAIANRPFFDRNRGRTEDFGSNAWALSSRGIAGGGSLLAGDGHLPFSVPGLLYQLGVDETVFGDASGKTQLGLFFPGVPVLPVGTNGRVAYSFTYLYGDLTDWYAEEIVLDTMGRPAKSIFRGAERDLVAVDDTYTIANVPALDSEGRTETWTRWRTFDGRLLAQLEGRVLAEGEMAAVGETVVQMQGVRLVPGDTNGDGKVAGVSFDYTGFDVSNLFGAVLQASRAQTVMDFRAAQHQFVGFAQNFAVSDMDGRVYYSGYTGAPCRTHLPRNGDRFAAGADPRLLLDGTRFGGFEVRLTGENTPDESAQSDETRCVVPFDQWPSSLDPDRGYVFTANNDLGGLSQDGSLANDTYYLGGPWAPGHRSKTISEALAAHVTARDGSIAGMAAIQGDHRSPVAIQVVPALRAALTRARGLSAPNTPEETRLRALYTSEMAGLDDADTRLGAWLGRGAIAESGVETFYDTPTAQDREDAVATTLFNVWWRELNGGLFDDEEGLVNLLEFDPRFLRTTLILRMLSGRGAGNTSALASFDPATNESVFFDDVTTGTVVESSDEMIVAALVRTLRSLRAAPSATGPGFGTSDPSQWLWGLRHQAAFESLITAYAGNVMGVDIVANLTRISTMKLPLGASIPATDPRAQLVWFPRPGDFLNVDAANSPSRTGADYVYRSGPVMRMVVQLQNGRVTGQNILPGGQSGLAASPHFADQAELWLGNQTVPMRFHVEDVVAGAVSRDTFHP